MEKQVQNYCSKCRARIQPRGSGSVHVCSIKTRFKAPNTGVKGRIPCLSCTRDFTSEDKIKNRICADCKKSEAWRGSRESDAMMSSGRGDIYSISEKKP